MTDALENIYVGDTLLIYDQKKKSGTPPHHCEVEVIAMTSNLHWLKVRRGLFSCWIHRSWMVGIVKKYTASSNL